MVMGHAVDHQLWSLIKQTLELFAKDLETNQLAIASIQEQQRAIDETVENQQQRIYEMEALQAKHAENYSRVMEMLEKLEAQICEKFIVKKNQTQVRKTSDIHMALGVCTKVPKML